MLGSTVRSASEQHLLLPRRARDRLVKLPTMPTNKGTSHMPTNPGSQGAQGTSNAAANPGSRGTSHKPSTPGPNASLPAKAEAYGRYCQTESKTHMAGTPGTPFSKCVTDMAKLANGSSKNPTAACKNETAGGVWRWTWSSFWR